MADGLPLTPEQERAALLERATLIQQAQEIQDQQSDVDPSVVDSPIMTGINTYIDDATFGHGPEAIAALDAFVPAAKGKGYVDSYKKLTKENRAILKAQQETNVNAKRVGNVGAFATHVFSPTMKAALAPLDKVKYLKNNPIAKNAVAGGGLSALQNPGETNNIADEILQRGSNVLSGTGMAAGLGIGFKGAKGLGSMMYKRGVKPLTHAIDMKLEDDIYPFLEKNGITGSLRGIRDQIQTKYDAAGKVVGDVLGTADAKGGSVNHRGLAARLKGMIPTAGKDSGEQDVNRGVSKYITDTVENYQSDAYRAAAPQYRSDMRAFTAAKRAQAEFDKKNPNIFTKFKDIIGLQNPSRPMTPARPVKPANEMGLEALNNIRISLARRSKQNFSNNQSNNVPVKAEVLGDMYPVMRDAVDQEVVKRSGKEALERLQPANNIYSLLKPNMDTINKAVVASEAPGKDALDKLLKIGYASTLGLVDNAPVMTTLGKGALRAGQYGSSKSGAALRNQMIPRFLRRNDEEEE